MNGSCVMFTCERLKIISLLCFILTKMNPVWDNLSRIRKLTTSKVNCCVFGSNSEERRMLYLNYHWFPNRRQKILHKTEFVVKDFVEKRQEGFELIYKIKENQWLQILKVCSLHFQELDYISSNNIAYNFFNCYEKRKTYFELSKVNKKELN